MNTGLREATGVWVGILDSDDICPPGMFSTLLESAADGNPDVIKGRFLEIDKNNHRRGKGNPGFHPVPDGHEFRPVDAPDIFVIHQSVWSGIYRKSYLDRFSIRFPEYTGGYQDTGFAYRLWLRNPRIR